jgi:hypothetical protein
MTEKGVRRKGSGTESVNWFLTPLPTVEVSIEDDDLSKSQNVPGGACGELYDHFRVPLEVANRHPRVIREDADKCTSGHSGGEPTD